MLQKCETCGGIGFDPCKHTTRMATEKEAIEYAKKVANGLLLKKYGIRFEELPGNVDVSEFISPDLDKYEFAEAVADMINMKGGN